jgi:hypothetical protein
MSEQHTQTEQAETIDKNQVFSFCRHLGRALKGVGNSDTETATNLMREAAYLEKNGFQDVSDMFAMVAETLDHKVPRIKVQENS